MFPSQNDPIKKSFYKGTIDYNINIWFYINEQEHPCGGNKTIINAMYRYDDQDQWILLNVTSDKQKKNFCFVEDNLSGVLFLEKKDNGFIGNWVSPNAHKQFPLELEKVELYDETSERLDEILFDELIFSKNDC